MFEETHEVAGDAGVGEGGHCKAICEEELKVSCGVEGSGGRGGGEEEGEDRGGFVAAAVAD